MSYQIQASHFCFKLTNSLCHRHIICTIYAGFSQYLGLFTKPRIRKLLISMICSAYTNNFRGMPKFVNLSFSRNSHPRKYYHFQSTPKLALECLDQKNAISTLVYIIYIEHEISPSDAYHNIHHITPLL